MARKPKSERKIQSEILSLIKSNPSMWACKVIESNERGTPDILCCIKGRFVSIEVKAMDGHLTTIQAAQMQRINVAGGMAYVVKSIQDFKDIFLAI